MKVAVFIDGGHLRVPARKADRSCVPDYIEKIARACIAPDESLLRNLYYDCAPYRGSPLLPVSGKPACHPGRPEGEPGTRATGTDCARGSGPRIVAALRPG